MTHIIRFTTFSTLAILLMLGSVSGAIAQISERPRIEGPEIRYYGTACFTIQYADNVLLTDPFISNPSASQAMFGQVKTDVDYVERYINPATLRKVRFAISGHAHYDHLMDFPYLSKYVPESTLLVANKTAKHIMAFYDLPQQTMVANDITGDEKTEGYWVYSENNEMRVMAFKSQHPPHFAGINLMNKKYDKDLTSEPVLARDWQEGQTLAFMVDWLEEDSIVYRIYFSSSLAKAPFSLFPKSMLDEHPIDDLFISAILVSDFDKAPKLLIDLAKPNRIFLMHWENLFRSKEKDVKAMRTSELKKLLKELKAAYGNSIEVIKSEPLNYY